MQASVVLAAVGGLLLVLVAALGTVATREPERYCSSAVGPERCWTEAEYSVRVRGQIEEDGWWDMCAPTLGSHLTYVKGVDLSRPSEWQTGRALAVRVIIAECAAWPEEERLKRGSA